MNWSKALAAASLLLTAGASRGDVITEWNLIGRTAASNAGGNLGNGANAQTRALAIEALAVNDAVVSITHGHAAYLGTVNYSGSASAEAAAVQAAATALTNLFPTQAATFASALSNDLAAIPDGEAKTNGILIGQTAANQLLSARANDGSSPSPAPPPYTGGTDPGEWRPTPPAFQAGAQPFWASVTPFVLQSNDQFRPGPPPALNSQAYQDALNEVRLIGDVNSATRTADQTQIAQFWLPSSTIAWNDIARAIVAQKSLTIDEEARVFALVNAALGDSRGAIWDAKYHYSFWRPVTAIDTTVDPNWTPLLTTPNHPSYVSGHSGSGAAAAEVLRELFGDNQHFVIGSVNPALPAGTTREYFSLTQAQQENGLSRIYGGIHYQFDNVAGQQLGVEVGQWVAANALAVPEAGSLSLLGFAATGIVAFVRWRRSSLAAYDRSSP